MAIKFLLATSGQQFNMVSSWEDELYCSILKDGSISLRPSKDGEDEYGGRWWFPSRRGIKTPGQFLEALKSIDEIEVDNWSTQEDLLPTLFEHAPLFAAMTYKMCDIDNEQDDLEWDFFLFSQRTLLKADVPLSGDFKSSVKFVEILFNYTKKHFVDTETLPKGRHELMGKTVIFPKRAVTSNAEILRFRIEQSIKRHVTSAKWRIDKSNRHWGFAMMGQRKEIENFCREFYGKHEFLPVGTFTIGHTDVTFIDKNG